MGQGNDPGCELGEFETQHPVTSNVLAIDRGRIEPPTAGSIHSQAREIFAGAGGIELGADHAAGRINMDSDRDAHGTVNGVARLLGNVGQNSFQNIAGNKNTRGWLGLRI